MKVGSELKYFYYVLSVIPVAFLFHFYEFGQNEKGQEATFLTVAWVGYMILAGCFAIVVKKRVVIVLQIVSLLISLLFAYLWIPDNGWFKPVGRDLAVVVVALLTLAGQLIVRSITKGLIKR